MGERPGIFEDEMVRVWSLGLRGGTISTQAVLLAVVTLLLACSSPIGAKEAAPGEWLLAAAEGLQMPSSESDSAWQVVSYGGVEGLPEADNFGEMVGCAQGGVTRTGFDETLASLGRVEPWMDAGQVRSAHGFRKLGRVFGREFGENLAVYRCEPGGPEVSIYFVGVADGRPTGLMTVSVET